MPSTVVVAQADLSSSPARDDYGCPSAHVAA